MSDKSRSRLKVSREGMVLIKSFEGFRPQAVRTASGRWTIGYGHTASAREGLVVDEEEAELLLQYDLLPVVKALNDQITQPLNQHQFDALASFAVSIGVDRFLSSDVLQELNAGRSARAADALFGWPETPSPDATIRRRAAERTLFGADPAAGVQLADLLTSPLPPPPVAPEPLATDTERAVPAGPAAPMAETPAPQPGADSAPAAAPAAQAVHHRFSPYRMPAGPLPGLPPVIETEAQAPQAPAAAPAASSSGVAPPAVEPEAAAAEGVGPDQTAEPVATSSAEPELSPFPTTETAQALAGAGGEPAADAVAAAEVSQEAQGGQDATAPTPDDSAPVLSHEAGPAARDVSDDGVKGAFAIMGLVGLGACAAAAAAFRKAITDETASPDFTVIAWVLTLIGLACVGVSAWNLYRRWGARD